MVGREAIKKRTPIQLIPNRMKKTNTFCLKHIKLYLEQKCQLYKSCQKTIEDKKNGKPIMSKIYTLLIYIYIAHKDELLL